MASLDLIVSEQPGVGVIIRFLSDLARSAKGATAVEYGLIVSLIVIAAMAAIVSVADVTINMWNNIAAEVLTHA